MVLTAKKIKFKKEAEKTILQMAQEKGISPEEVIVELVHKELAWAKFRAVQKKVAPKLQAEGWTEERALNEIS